MKIKMSPFFKRLLTILGVILGIAAVLLEVVFGVAVVATVGQFLLGTLVLGLLVALVSFFGLG